MKKGVVKYIKEGSDNGSDPDPACPHKWNHVRPQENCQTFAET